MDVVEADEVDEAAFLEVVLPVAVAQADIEFTLVPSRLT